MAPYNNAPETGTRNGRSADRGAGAGALVGGALFVSVIALCALFIAYEGIYRLAAIVHADSTLPLAHVFPLTFTLLVLMAFWVSYILRTAPPGERLWIDIGLIPLLILSAAVPMVLTRTAWFGEIGDTLPRGLTVVVAVAPLAALLVAFLMWIAVRAHVRRRGALARPRPKPSDDRTTVLRGASKPRPRPEEAAPEAPEALRTRLLRLGGDPEAAEESETTETEVPSEPSEKTFDVREPEESVRVRRIEPRESRERSEATENAGTLHDTAPKDDSESPTEPVPGPWDHADETSTEVYRAAASEPAEVEASPIPLPRRARTGDNPIKRAATEPPVVPGAASPEPAESTGSYAHVRDTSEDTAKVPEHVVDEAADEGFSHAPEVGDPSSDEAEAPIPPPSLVEPAVHVEPEVAAPDTAMSAGTSGPGDVYTTMDTGTSEAFEEGPNRSEDLPGVRLFFPEHAPEPWDAVESPDPGAAEPSREPSEPLAESVTEAPTDQVGANVTEPSTTDQATAQENDTPLWEPPSDEYSTSPLDDYVPPVWTPPEDETPAPDGPTPPIGTAGSRTDPGPGITLDHDTGPAVRAAFRLGSVPPGAARPEPEDAGRPEETTETREERPENEVPRASSRRTAPLRKRPMVLKPPRPPMPDFASGPPSRRVRSEPLPPGDD